MHTICLPNVKTGKAKMKNFKFLNERFCYICFTISRIFLDKYFQIHYWRRNIILPILWLHVLRQLDPPHVKEALNKSYDTTQKY